jgi:serine/threonine protein kinase/ankyrin repeat protein
MSIAALLVAAVVLSRSPPTGVVVNFEASNAASFAEREHGCALCRRSPEDALIDGGWTTLTYASEVGEDEVVAQLLEDGALPDVPDASGRTALVRASRHGHTAVVKRLLEAGAQAHLENADGSTAFSVASEQGRLGIVRMLLNASCARGARGARGALQPSSTQLIGRPVADEHAEGVATLSPEQANALAMVEEEMELLGLVGRAAGRRPGQTWRASPDLIAAASRMPMSTFDAHHALSQSVHADQGLPIRRLLGAGARVDLWRAFALAQKNGHAAVASLLSDPSNLLLMTQYEAPQVPSELIRAAERDLRAIEGWLRSGAMSAVNNTKRLEQAVSDLLAGWDGGPPGGGSEVPALLDALGAEEDVAAVVARLRSHGVWVEVLPRVCGGFVMRFRAACYAIEVERLLVATRGSLQRTRSQPSVSISRGARSGASSSARVLGKPLTLAGYLGQRVAVKRRVGASFDAAKAELLDADKCDAYDCTGCGEYRGAPRLPSGHAALGSSLSSSLSSSTRPGQIAATATAMDAAHSATFKPATDPAQVKSYFTSHGVAEATKPAEPGRAPAEASGAAESCSSAGATSETPVAAGAPALPMDEDAADENASKDERDSQQATITAFDAANLAEVEAEMNLLAARAGNELAHAHPADFVVPASVQFQIGRAKANESTAFFVRRPKREWPEKVSYERDGKRVTESTAVFLRRVGAAHGRAAKAAEAAAAARKTQDEVRRSQAAAALRASRLLLGAALAAGAGLALVCISLLQLCGCWPSTERVELAARHAVIDAAAAPSASVEAQAAPEPYGGAGGRRRPRRRGGRASEPARAAFSADDAELPSAGDAELPSAGDAELRSAAVVEPARPSGEWQLVGGRGANAILAGSSANSTRCGSSSGGHEGSDERTARPWSPEPALPAPPPLPRLTRGLATGQAAEVSYSEIVRGTADFADRRRIGQGGFGVVWKAQLPSMGVGSYAVKRLDPKRALARAAAAEGTESEAGARAGSASAEMAAAVQAEVELLACCSHPHVLPVVGFCLDPLALCLVYPLCAGGNFEDRLVPSDAGAQRLRLLGLQRPAPLAWQHRLSVVRDVADALVYLHTPTVTKPRILHRDVKPSNILLSLLASDSHASSMPPLTAWLSDVGVAKADERDRLGASATGAAQPAQHTHLSTSTVRGTPGFVDSLVVNGLQHSEATDGFALGVTLLMSLTGLPAVGLFHRCHELLRRTDDVAAWEHLLDGFWPRSVAAEVAQIAHALCMPLFREDRLPLPDALRQITSVISQSSEALAQGRLGTAGAGSASTVAADELRCCVVCDDAPREVRFRCGHACCCAECAKLVEHSGSQCPICRGRTHPLCATGVHLRDAATFEEVIGWG